MRYLIVRFTLVLCVLAVTFNSYAVDVETQAEEAAKTGYVVGVNDVLDINILEPDKLNNTVVVAWDGSISFPYIGNVQVKGLTLSEVQQIIQQKLSEGYIKYPVVVVSLKESHSKKFYVYGEVAKPGAYALDENITVLRAISLAGGFTKYGSSSRIKVLRPMKEKPGYERIKVNIAAVMGGNAKKDVVLQPGDIVVVSEGLF